MLNQKILLEGKKRLKSKNTLKRINIYYNNNNNKYEEKRRKRV